MKKHILAALAASALCPILSARAGDIARPLVLKSGAKTTLLFTPGTTGDKLVRIHILRGTASVDLSFGPQKTENKDVILSEGSSSVLTAHALRITATDGAEVLGFYQIEDGEPAVPAKAPPAAGGTPPVVVPPVVVPPVVTPPKSGTSVLPDKNGGAGDGVFGG